MNRKSVILLFLFFAALLHSEEEKAPFQVRIKDIADIERVESLFLTGYGIVTGLAGKGDSKGNALMKKAVRKLLGAYGVEIEESDIESKNCAVVMVNALVEENTKKNGAIDIVISSVGDARSIENGTLMLTELVNRKGEIWAVAQGKIGGAENKNKTSINLRRGARLKKDMSKNMDEKMLSIILKYSDYNTVKNIAEKIESEIKNIEIIRVDDKKITIKILEKYEGDLMNLAAKIENIEVVPAGKAKIVINQKTGVIIIGEKVKIGKIAISYKGLNINIDDSYYGDEKQEQFIINETQNVEDLIDVMKQIGLKTVDIIKIFKSIEESGALYGELILL